MTEFGHFALLTAWLLALAGCITGVVAGRTRRISWLLTTVNATLIVAACSLIALFALGYAFYTSDYTLQYVWQFSNQSMPSVYKISAIWGGMDGSMLLWCGMLAVCGGVVAFKSNKYPQNLMPWVLAVMNSSTLFFLTVVVFLTNPFRHIKADFIPPDGNGLNPLLQNPFMAIHPPTLYMGFTMLAVPYAFCLGALLAGSLSNDWIRLTRRYTLIAWGFLTAGIVLGGYWAYIELGWGGFWAWDPVENASFLPWLTATAFIHSVMVQERKNMLRFWNVWLVVGTYALTVFGTFLTRSGVVQSVHSFASTNVGWVFLVYIALIFIATALLTYMRRDNLRSERKIESFLSREAAFLLNNLVLLSICFAILWGVLFPVFSEAVTGQKQAVSIPFFNAVNVPLFLILIFLMGIGPLIAWKKATLKSIRSTFMGPFLVAFAIAPLLVWAGVVNFYPVLSYCLCFFVLLTVLGEFHRGLKAQRGAADKSNIVTDSTKLIKRHHSRYAGYLVHLGVLVATVGITASMAHKVEKEFTLAEGESFMVGRFELNLEHIEGRQGSNYQALYAAVNLKERNSGELLEKLEPELRVYFLNRGQENTSEVAIRKSWREDVYLVLAGFDQESNRAALKVYINPLQNFLWLGVVIMLLGTIVLLIPRKGTLRERVLADVRNSEVHTA